MINRVLPGSTAAILREKLSLFTIHLLILCAMALMASISYAQTTHWVSTDSDCYEANGSHSNPAISAEGRFIAFESTSDNLVSDDTNNTQDIFLHDRTTGETIRVSVDSEGNQADADTAFQSLMPTISANGRYIAFWSSADNLVPDDNISGWDSFVHDRITGETTRVNVTPDGEESIFGSGVPAISGDGRYVAFSSYDFPSLGDTNQQWDVFVHDRETSQLSLITTSPEGQPSNGTSAVRFISADGRYLVFESLSSNLVPGDTNEAWDVFVHDRIAGQTTRVSVDSEGNEVNNDPEWFVTSMSISADGRYVAFHSYADDLVPDDTNQVDDVFLHDRLTGETTRVSVDSYGNEANGFSDSASISTDGRYVTFFSSADNLVPDDDNGRWDVFVHDRITASTYRVSVDSSGNQANGGSMNPVMSANGMFVAFQSLADNLVVDQTSTYYGYEIFIHGPLPPVLELPIDIAPRREPNRANPEHGRIDVALLWDGTLELTQIDTQSVEFGPSKATSVRNYIVDVNDDGALDWVFSFKAEETGIECGDLNATLRGASYSGIEFVGTDQIVTIGCR